ncbi:hypothetical protein HNQ34_003436 [Anoxybacillus tepidamans]|uniref:Uncharacterized protein n=1 Tax=Anoxybacteroides tepidamans TaxID=265948 RepID=A0A7W8IV09_9BACL|nr:hypothetical protein [Anoxybacillus tepidamans]
MRRCGVEYDRISFSETATAYRSNCSLNKHTESGTAKGT